MSSSVVSAFEISNQSELKKEIEHSRRFSPIVEKIYLTISTNKSFVRAEEDIELLSGIKVSKNSVHRMVKRYE